MPASPPSDTAPAATKKKRKVSPIILIGGVFVILVALTRPYWSQALLAQLALRTDTPSLTALITFEESTTDPVADIKRLRARETIPHRQFAIGWIRRLIRYRPEAYDAVLPIIREASMSVHTKIRTLALPLLATSEHEIDRQIQMQALQDADPEVPRQVLWSMIRAHFPREYAGYVIPLLDSSDEGIRIATTSVLRRWFEQDFGVRYFSQNSPRSEGLANWHTWLDAHPEEVAVIQPWSQSLQESGFARIDETITTDQGDTIELDAPSKTPRILVFWSPIHPQSLRMIKDLSKHVDTLGVDMTIIAIDVSNVDVYAMGTDDAHAELIIEAQALQALSETPVDKAGIHAINATGDADLLNQFDAHELPTTVFLDTNARIQRHFSGERSTPALQAMLQAFTASGGSNIAEVTQP